MDPRFCKAVAELAPKMNEKIARNIVVDKMQDVESYVDRLWRNSKDSLPKDLVYHGLRRCMAREQFHYLSGGKKTKGKDSGKLTFDLAPSDVFMVMLEFRWYGAMESGDRREPGKDYCIIRHPLLLPAVGQGGKMRLRGANFILSAVLADPVISYTKDMAFIMLPRDKITVKRTPYQFLSNDTPTGIDYRHYLSLPWSQIYHLTKQSKVNGDNINHTSVTTLGHYLFAKYGVSECFRRFAGVEAVTGRNLAERDFPRDQWVIYRTMGVIPKGFSISKSGKSRSASAVRYKHPDIQIAVGRGGTERIVLGLVGAFLYLIDRYYDRFPEDYPVEEFANAPDHWRTLLGLIIFNNNNADARLLRDVNHHIDSLDLYVDEIQQKKFKQENIPCDDFYEFMAYLIDNVTIEMSRVDTTTMFGKELMVLEYVMEDVRKSIFKLGFHLKTTERGKRQNNRKEMTNRDVQKALRNQVATEAILNIQSNRDKREKVATSIQSPGDCMLFKVSTHVVLQSQNAGGAALADESRLVSGSIPFCASYLNLPHSEPTGRQKFSMYAPIDERGRLIITPQIANDVAATNAGLKKDVGRFDEEIVEINDRDIID